MKSQGTGNREQGTDGWSDGSRNREPIAVPPPQRPISCNAAGEPPITRRGFLHVAAGSLVAGVSSRFPVPGSPFPGRVAAQPIGLQLYTVRAMMERNMEFTLRDVAAIGYREVEFAGLFDTDVQKVEKWLTKYQLTSPASHQPLARLKSGLQGVIREARALGQTYIVCPWIDAPDRRDAAGWRRVAADFNRIGESLQRAGLRFAYHNHDFEFEKLPTGEVGYDILLAECDPKLVKMELDLYWITKGGRDPLAYFEKWPGRFPLVHVKDMTGKGVMTNVGQGHIDWGRIFAKRREAGIEHFFVEHDNPASPLDDIKTSFTFMKTLGL